MTSRQLGCSGGLARGCAPHQQSFLRGGVEEERALNLTDSSDVGSKLRVSELFSCIGKRRALQMMQGMAAVVQIL